MHVHVPGLLPFLSVIDEDFFVHGDIARGDKVYNDGGIAFL